jgi:hypothetical protein
MIYVETDRENEVTFILYFCLQMQRNEIQPLNGFFTLKNENDHND